MNKEQLYDKAIGICYNIVNKVQSTCILSKSKKLSLKGIAKYLGTNNEYIFFSLGITYRNNNESISYYFIYDSYTFSMSISQTVYDPNIGSDHFSDTIFSIATDDLDFEDNDWDMYDETESKLENFENSTLDLIKESKDNNKISIQLGFEGNLRYEKDYDEID